ncbi:hypothetical protein CEB3_c12750 [Peptococcaceae bacterium CEB3]|nr:hypothetical protein CEB3_c12750 [Peptococcaceae bacterium CEB3]
MMIKLKRVYEETDKDDGYRVLVDRLWPRGRNKSDAKIDEWLKDIAPSAQLRKWYSHDVSKWPEFKERYFKELSAKEEMVRLLIEKASGNTLTLIYAAQDVEHNNAAALKEFIEKTESEHALNPGIS